MDQLSGNGLAQRSQNIRRGGELLITINQPIPPQTLHRRTADGLRGAFQGMELIHLPAIEIAVGFEGAAVAQGAEDGLLGGGEVHEGNWLLVGLDLIVLVVSVLVMLEAWSAIVKHKASQAGIDSELQSEA